jgi:hypothetical protein
MIIISEISACVPDIAVLQMWTPSIALHCTFAQIIFDKLKVVPMIMHCEVSMDNSQEPPQTLQNLDDPVLRYEACEELPWPLARKTEYSSSGIAYSLSHCGFPHSPTQLECDLFVRHYAMSSIARPSTRLGAGKLSA